MLNCLTQGWALRYYSSVCLKSIPTSLSFSLPLFFIFLIPERKLVFYAQSTMTDVNSATRESALIDEKQGDLILLRSTPEAASAELNSTELKSRKM